MPKPRSVPRTRARDYLSLARLVWPRPDKSVGETIACTGTLYAGLIEPLLLILMGLLVAFILISLYLPIFSFSLSGTAK